MPNINGFSNFEFSNHINKVKLNLLKKYINILLDYNKKVNLVSRRITLEQLTRLVDETIQLNPLISNKVVVDAGSGNGLIGIPLAILTKYKNIVLVEKKLKKIDFLLEVKKRIPEINFRIVNSSIENYLKQNQSKKAAICLVARGFPDQDILINFLFEGIIKELILITAKKKIRKIKKGMESITKKIYNINFRDNLKILKMEYVSRETN